MLGIGRIDTTPATASAQDRQARGATHPLLASLRLHQWSKNLFVLAPLVFGRKLGEAAAIEAALWAFVCFCLMSSALYLFNDILDLQADRAHPVKKLRPIASGKLSLRAAWLSSIGLLAISLSVALRLGPNFLSPTLSYLALSALYSLALKKILLLDAITIAAGFVLRVAAGAVAVGVEPSPWLLACAFLLALYLAFVKRHQEMMLLSSDAGLHRRALGEYTRPFLGQVNVILLGSTFVCYMLYAVAPETVERFGTDRLIYGSVFVLYGLLRSLLLSQAEENAVNPGLALVRDKPLAACVLGWAIYNILVIYRFSIFQL